MLFKNHIRFLTWDMTSHRMPDMGIKEYDKIEHCHIIKEKFKIKKILSKEEKYTQW